MWWLNAHRLNCNQKCAKIVSMIIYYFTKVYKVMIWWGLFGISSLNSSTRWLLRVRLKKPHHLITLQFCEIVNDHANQAPKLARLCSFTFVFAVFSIVCDHCAAMAAQWSSVVLVAVQTSHPLLLFLQHSNFNQGYERLCGKLHKRKPNLKIFTISNCCWTTYHQNAIV